VGEGSYNSPWNIAVNFTVDMSFNPDEIATMLIQYEEDHHSGMDIPHIAQEIYDFTDGYPFLVSRICQAIDEELGKNWSLAGVTDAVKIILSEKNTLFDSITKNLENNEELFNFTYDILIGGIQKGFQIDNPVVNAGVTCGIFKNKNSAVALSNRIFETRLYDYLISKDESGGKRQIAGVTKEEIIKQGRFDMELCLRKFARHYDELFSENDAEFLERHGRLLFLSYLKPLINGKGFYHVESETRNVKRMDIVVDYGDEQFIIELKIWRGDSKHRDAYEQLSGYLDAKNAATGYLLTFDFRREQNKQPKAEWVEFDGKRIFDVVV
jgi:hypothetical protein